MGLARRTQRRLGRAAPELPQVPLRARDVTIAPGYIGAGYGAPTEAALAAQRLLAEHEGMALETTYTAKCMAALLDLAAAPPYRGQTLLFWTRTARELRGAVPRLDGMANAAAGTSRFFNAVADWEGDAPSAAPPRPAATKRSHPVRRSHGPV